MFPGWIGGWNGGWSYLYWPHIGRDWEGRNSNGLLICSQSGD